jgi:hypothetical protein
MTVNNKLINFKFEKFDYNYSITFQWNLYAGNLVNFINQKNYRPSQVVESLFHLDQRGHKRFNNLQAVGIDDPVDHYIISTAVLYHPNDWTDKKNKFSPFELLNSKYLEDLKNGRALLLIDQSVEGYQTEWLWDWFHKKCEIYNIDPSAIIYLTGNQLCAEQYDSWHAAYSTDRSKLKVLASTSLSLYIYQTYQQEHLTILFDNILDYKQENLKNISLYDCTNLRARPQRVLNYLHLTDSNLVLDGKISIGDKKDWPHLSIDRLKKYNLPENIVEQSIAPLAIDHNRKLDIDYHVYITRILNDVYQDTWVSLITESSYFDYEHSVFISEKTFKPIACMQPFIIVGSKHTLKYLRQLGYRTFDGFIDESYDDCDDKDRFAAIINSLEKIKKIEDKISWLASIREILEHNHKLFLSIGNTESFEYQEITKYYGNYFQNIK